MFENAALNHFFICLVYRNQMPAQTRRNRMNRKASRKNTRKNMAGGKRSEWLKKVMRVYKDMKARNPAAKLGDAMRAAKRA